MKKNIFIFMLVAANLSQFSCLARKESLATLVDNVEDFQTNLLKSDTKKQDPAMFLSLQKFFNRTFDYQEHQLTTNNTREDAYNLVNKWIFDLTFWPDIFFSLTMTDFEPTKNIANDSELVPTGDWFDFNLKYLTAEINFRFKIKNVSTTKYDDSHTLLTKIANYFTKEFNFNEHQITVDWHQGTVLILLNKWIENKFGILNYDLVIKDFVSDENVKNDSELVSNGAHFDCTITVNDQSQDFRFLAKNIGNDLNHGWSLYFQEYFEQEFNFSSHQFTVSNTRAEITTYIEKLVTEVFTENKNDDNAIPSFAVVVDNVDEETTIKNDSELVPTGDWFNFTLTINDYCLENLRLKIGNVGSDRTNGWLLVLKDYFAKEFDFNEHYLTNEDTRAEVHDLITSWIYELIPAELSFTLVMTDYEPEKKISNDSELVPTGDWFDFTISINDQSQDFRFQAKNVKDEITSNQLETTGQLALIKEWFENSFGFIFHNLTIENTREDAFNLVKTWIEKIYKKDFTLVMTDYEPEKTISNDSELVPTGDWFDFTITSENQETTFRLKITNVGATQTNGYFLDLIKIFDNTFSKAKDNLSPSQTQEDVYNLVNNLIKQMLNNLDFELTIDDYQAEQNLSEGENIFNFTIKIEELTQSFQFKFDL